jgi:glycine/D-amino acid oxidase-like deaminating enzyme
MVSLTLEKAKAIYPALENVEIAQAWGAWIDTMPDAMPVISQAPSLPGFFIAAGLSGHGFGLGPGAGHLAADIITGDVPISDPGPYQYSRFFDGSRIQTPGGI